MQFQTWRLGYLALAGLVAALAGCGANSDSELDAQNADKKEENVISKEDAVRALKLSRKSICSLNDGEHVLYWWQGALYSRVPGEKDTKLFGLQGINMRQCGTVSDPVRGEGYRSVSREIMIHLDPETNEIVDSWTNPWTGEEVEVLHVANDPVNMRQPAFPMDEDGIPTATFRGTFINGKVITGGEAPLFYTNPLAGDYQEYVGGTYHAMEMTNFYMSEEDLLDLDTPTIKEQTLSWSRTSKWLPWMKMGDRPGMLLATTVGRRMGSVEELPEPIRSVLKERYPLYMTPPPVDDPRPNDTTWTVFKRYIDAEREGQASGNEGEH